MNEALEIILLTVAKAMGELLGLGLVLALAFRSGLPSVLVSRFGLEIVSSMKWRSRRLGIS